MSIEDGFAKKRGHDSAKGRTAPGGRRGPGEEETYYSGDGDDLKDGDGGSPAARHADERADKLRADEDPDEGYLDDDYEDDDFRDDEDDLDLFDDVEIGGHAEDDAGIAQDQGMEDKILGQAMGGGKRGGAFGHGEKRPRELNTPGSAVDQRALKKEREEKKHSRVKRAVIWAVVEALTLLVIFAYGYVARTFSTMGHTEVNKAAVENENLSVEKKKEMEGYWNFYIFGLDNRDGRVSRGNSDVIMIASINQDTGDIKLVSVFRDTYLNVNSKNSYNKINQAYAQGGPEQAIATLNKNLDLNITNYVTVNWEAVAHGINILGGIDDVDISPAELYYINGYITDVVKYTGIGSHQLKQTGPQHLDGVQAVAYGRLRLMDSDFARTERQREVLEKCFEKAKKADFAVLNNILVDCFPMVAIDIPMNDLVRMAQSISRYKIAGTAGFPWSRGDANLSGKGAVVVPTTLESNVIKLHEFLFGATDYTPSDAVIAYSEKIKEDTSLYKEGRPIESVGTNNGVIQKPKKAASDEDDEIKESTGRHAEDEEEDETDEDGELIYPTDEDGNPILPTDENGETIRQTDEDGNALRPGRPQETRPTDLAETTEGDAGSEIVDDAGNVIGTSPQRPSHAVNPTAGTQETKPQHTVNPTAEAPAESSSAHEINPTAPTAAPQRPTELVPDEPQTVAPPAPGGNAGPQESSATVISPTRPEPTADNSGPGGGMPGGGQETVITPGGGPNVGPGV